MQTGAVHEMDGPWSQYDQIVDRQGNDFPWSLAKRFNRDLQPAFQNLVDFPNPLMIVGPLCTAIDLWLISRNNLFIGLMLR